MKSFIVVLLAVMACAVTPTIGYRWYRCSLAQELYDLDVPYEQLAAWTCIAEHESNYTTDAINTDNDDGSVDYGIFQINDRYWCRPPNKKKSANRCNVSCKALLSDDITRSVRCAQKIKREDGWKAWTTWKYCNGKLRSIDDCFRNRSNSNSNRNSTCQLL